MNTVCVACGATSLRPHLTVRRDREASLAATTTAYGTAPGDLVRCDVCGHIQVAQLPSDLELGEAYAEVDEEAYLGEEAGQRATARRALSLIERHLGAGPSRGEDRALCDLGCWVGFLLSEAERRGWSARGVEPSDFAAGYARERLGLDVQTATLESADLPAGTFDAAVLGDVIEHLPDPGAALDRIAGLLRPRGVLYLTLPDAGSRIARLLGGRWWSVIPTHVQYFNHTSMARLLHRHGYSVEYLDTAPKAFTVRYYLERLEGYSPPVARAAVWTATRVGLSGRLVWPDFRDRMAVLARLES